MSLSFSHSLSLFEKQRVQAEPGIHAEATGPLQAVAPGSAEIRQFRWQPATRAGRRAERCDAVTQAGCVTVVFSKAPRTEHLETETRPGDDA